jgi:hypothetical protein
MTTRFTGEDLNGAQYSKAMLEFLFIKKQKLLIFDFQKLT